MLKKQIACLLPVLAMLVGLGQNSYAGQACNTQITFACPAANKVVSGFHDQNWYVYRGYIGLSAPKWESVWAYLRDDLPEPVCVYRTFDGNQLLLVSLASFCSGANGTWTGDVCESGNSTCTFYPTYPLPNQNRSHVTTKKSFFEQGPTEGLY